MKAADPCYKCGQLRDGELLGDDACRYFKFVCEPCNKKWTINAPSVKAPPKGENDGSGKKTDGDKG